MSFVETTKMRMERVEWQFRAFKKYLQLKEVIKRTDRIKPGEILAFSTVRNELPRLAYFLDYYRHLGVDHFFFVDNDSDDGTREYLCEQSDTSVWTTQGSYKRAKFGMDWMNALLNLYAHGHWALVVDVDEFLVYPKVDTRNLHALTDWLDASKRRSFGAMLIDMYSKSPIADNVYQPGEDPFKTLNYFDSGNYVYEQNEKYANLWIQGGPRQRVFFSDNPELGPALNKIPLVKWRRGVVYISSTHTILPRGLNRVYDMWGGEKASGCLLHAKFLSIFAEKAEEELERGQHYAASREYRAYQAHLAESQGLWTPNSTRLTGWNQLENLGLISSGGWL